MRCRSTWVIPASCPRNSPWVSFRRHKKLVKIQRESQCVVVGEREHESCTQLSFGAEYAYNNQFFLRAGYYYENEFKGNRQYLGVGAGFSLNVVRLDASGKCIPISPRAMAPRIASAKAWSATSASLFGNADITIIAQRPKMRPYIDSMRKNVAADLDVSHVGEIHCVTSAFQEGRADRPYRM